MIITRTSGLILPKTHPSYPQIETHLTRTVYDFNGEISRLLFYEDFDDHILIPRYYPIEDQIEDETIDGEEINLTSIIIPRNTRQEMSIDFLVNNNKGVLQLEPSVGKTVISVDAICKINRKAIIFAHKKQLLEQWKDTFLKFTDITEDDIGKLSTANYKKVLNKKIILCTPHVISLAVKRNKTKFLEKLNSSGIGVSIIDEVHVGLGPEEFSKASLHINCKRTFGLSATPTRTDGNDDIIRYHVGDITYFPPTDNELLKPKVYILYFDFGIYKKYKGYLNWGGKFSSTRYLKQMHKVDKYIKTVASLIDKCFNEGRNTLILGNRVAALIALAKKCKASKKDIGLYAPTSTDEDRLSISDTTDLNVAFKEKQIVFSTYLGGRDGSNREDLDCLIHSTTSSNVEQSVGRILRRKDGKSQPVVFDLVDTGGPTVKSYKDKTKKINLFLHAAKKRKEVFESKGWEIKEIWLGEDR